MVRYNSNSKVQWKWKGIDKSYELGKRFIYYSHNGKEENTNKVEDKSQGRSFRFYLLILPVEENNAQLEIINGSCLKQKACYSYYNSKKMAIIGIAESQYSANEIVLQIVNESVKNTGDADIKSYLLEKYRNELW